LHKEQNQTEIGELTSKEKDVITKMTKGDKEAENGEQSPEATKSTTPILASKKDTK